jgi:ABC-type glycerol-3-phosphate transport system substrate-binding protein
MLSSATRRTVLRTAALASAAVITAPYVRDAYAAGKLTLGCWDHWVPGANKALDKICAEWGEKNKVEVHIDYITSQGEKDKLTAAAEAQAGTGHDIIDRFCILPDVIKVLRVS